MTAKEYGSLFNTWCELKGETPQSVHGSDVLTFNRDTRWMGMAINLITREVISNPDNVAKTTAFGVNDNEVYTLIVDLTFFEVYAVDTLGELIETFPLRVENGVFIGRLQNYF